MAPSDLDNAVTAVTYARNGDADKACTLLNGIGDDALRTIIGAYVHYFLLARGGCPGADSCSELMSISKRLGELEKQAESSLKKVFEEHPGLKKYAVLRSFGRTTEETLSFIIKEARSFALSGLGYCALRDGDFVNAEEYYRLAAAASRKIEGWEDYLFDMANAIGAKALRGEELGDVVNEFKDLWNEALARRIYHRGPSDLYLKALTSVLSGYLITLTLMGKHEEARKLLKKHGKYLYMNWPLGAITRLVLKYLGVNAEELSSRELLSAVEPGTEPVLLPALAEILGAPMKDKDVTKTCTKSGDSDSCYTFYLAVRGDEAAEKTVKQFIIDALSRAGVPIDLLASAGVKQLIEVYAPVNSLTQFILLVRALVNGDRTLALLHAETGRAVYGKNGGFLGELFDELVNALWSSDENSVKRALARLCYYYL